MFELREVNIAYGNVHVIYDASLQIKKQEIVSLVGSNGAGKTTILRTISGLLKPLSGEIVFEGIRIDQLPPSRIVDLGISQVPEGRKLFVSMRVEINLEMGAIRRQARQKRQANMRKLYALFPVLAERKNQLAGSLSGGEQQMLAIGRSLMSDPKLLIMDEPSLGLSPLLVKNILDRIVAVRNEGTTVLLVEQNLVQALRISDLSYILETGRITQRGTGAEFLQDEHIKKKYLGI